MKKILVSYFVIFALFSVLFIQCKKDDSPAIKADIKWASIFSDDFQRADGSIGSSYSIEAISANGQDLSGIADIYQNQLRISDSCYWAVWHSNQVSYDTLKVSVKCYTNEGASSHIFGVTAKHRKLQSKYEQEFYAAFAISDTIGIQKCQGMTPLNLVTKYFKIQSNHIYKIELVVINANLTLNIEDITSGLKETLSVTDTGTLLSGTTVGINGNSITNGGVILFDDFLIEKGINN